ncbi:hypothetical protein [Mesorhizobium sp. YR577]|uniref:hypothetical protein n=1 Tax=Mesorhizobium sp. YR577 TaxID=1884373 RepID=UPI0015870E19|nr:hypothetical protein [Mesorhizobium sp. YR577]
MAGYSVQQIKFELLSYLKEFGGKGSDWTIGCMQGPPDGGELAASNNPEGVIWICKPALSARAARLVWDHMVSRHRLHVLPEQSAVEDGSWVLMFRRIIDTSDSDGRRLFEMKRSREKQVATRDQLS